MIADILLRITQVIDIVILLYILHRRRNTLLGITVLAELFTELRLRAVHALQQKQCTLFGSLSDNLRQNLLI